MILAEIEWDFQGSSPLSLYVEGLSYEIILFKSFYSLLLFIDKNVINGMERCSMQEKLRRSIVTVHRAISDRSLDSSGSNSESHVKQQVERKSESTFQRKITVSQTQL